MRLADELVASNCTFSEDDFRLILLKRLTSTYPDRTIDDLLCTPADADAYCDEIRRDIDNDNINNAVILKTLVNLRKSKSAPTRGNARSPRNLTRELSSIGWTGTVDDFKDFVIDRFADMYKSRTIDELLCHPREAHELCKFVRNRSGITTLTDDLILSTLINVRKAGHR